MKAGRMDFWDRLIGGMYIFDDTPVRSMKPVVAELVKDRTIRSPKYRRLDSDHRVRRANY